MSKSWNELKNKSGFRQEIEKWYSEEKGAVDAYKEVRAHITLKPEETNKNIYITLTSIASLCEGLIAVEKRLESIEKRLEQLEELDKHR